MKSLFDYETLLNEVFYKCWHILEYIENHPDMSDLDKDAIKATIMEALVSKQLIDPNSQSLDFENLCIVDDLDHYNYEKHPNISGIPLWMKEEFRKKSIYITGGIPVSVFLAKPPSKFIRYCVCDPNTAVSSIFEDATFYNSVYNSPTRGIRIEEKRPFVEVEIDGELYLVDTLTKRILKSSWFKEKYGFLAVSKQKISEMDDERLGYYKEAVSDDRRLANSLSFMLPILEYGGPEHAEQRYEVEQSKRYFPEQWAEYEEIKKEIKQFMSGNFSLTKKP